MNDEDFARTLLTRAASGGDEPRLGLDVDRLVHDGRRASRTRVAGLATGGTVLAGVVALSAWSLSGLGSQPQGTAVGPGAGSSAAKSDLQQQKKDQQSAAPDQVKGSHVTPCTTTIDLEAVLRTYLPASTTISSATKTTCLLMDGKARSVDVRVQLTNPSASLSVSLQSGAAMGVESPSVSAADKKAKEAIAAKDGDPVGTCHTLADGWQACVTHLTKGGTKLSVISLSIPGPTDGAGGRAVALSAGGPETGGPVPFTDASLVELAHNVATHTS